MKKLKVKGLSFVLALLFLAGCGKSDDAEVVPPSAENQKNEAGPYDVAFSGDGQAYEHSMKGFPNSDVAKIEYKILLNERSQISVIQTELKVAGCSASQVSYNSYWIPDATKPEEGRLVMPGLSFEVQPGIQGVLLHLLKGLNGCSTVEFFTSLRKQKIVQPNPGFPVGQACEGTTDGCKVQVYCREQGALSNYLEVEVWSRPSGTYLQSFMKSSDGSRGLMTSETVTSSISTGTSKYTGRNTNLSFDRTTGVGTMNRYFNGQNFPARVDCGYLN